MNIFSQFKGIFPDKIKIAKVLSIFKNAKKSTALIYSRISVLAYFSKMLEHIMYNRLHSYLTRNNILFNRQFVFQTGHSTEHVLLELVDQISNTFNDKTYLLGIFINLSKTFNTVDHRILVQKL